MLLILSAKHQDSVETLAASWLPAGPANTFGWISSEWKNMCGLHFRSDVKVCLQRMYTQWFPWKKRGDSLIFMLPLFKNWSGLFCVASLYIKYWYTQQTNLCLMFYLPLDESFSTQRPMKSVDYTFYWVWGQFNWLYAHYNASQFAAIYISHSSGASNRVTRASLQTESLPDVPPLSSPLFPFLPSTSFLSFLFSKAVISLENLSPGQASAPLSVLTHTSAHARTNTWVRPRHPPPLTPCQWALKSAPIKALFTIIGQWPLDGTVSLPTFAHTKKGEVVGVGSPPPLLTLSSRQVWEPKWSRCSKAPLPPSIFHRKKRTENPNHSKL